ncbi:MAG: DUF429 domain-containing protein [Acetobacteraceae bacterium]|nr:DUF429 domain-containing protein [Acetobacteraceae bacterium]
MLTLCGIDVGSLRTPAHVAWLLGRCFLLDLYLPSVQDPLPRPPDGWPPPACIALDAPQGLPQPGQSARACDRLANAPTRRLPADRRELSAWRLYRGLVEAGVELFWSIYERGLGSVAGLGGVPPGPVPTVVETYPRYVIRRLWPELRIPSKTGAPQDYVDAVFGRIRRAGYSCGAVAAGPPRTGSRGFLAVDHVDAMVGALAAEAWLAAGGPPPGTVGRAPAADWEGRVLREGFIVSP